MTVRSWMGGFAVVALCAGTPALAIEATQVDDWLNFDQERTKVGLDVRAGVGGLTGDLGERTAPGPFLGIAAGAQPWRFLGIEAAYEGQRLPIDDARVGDEQAMYRHNVTLAAKAGPMLMNNKLRPYVASGIGVSYLNATDGADTVYDNDFIREVPLAAGVDYRFTQSIFAGVRGSYRLLFGEEFVDSPTAVGDAEGNLFNVGLQVGGRF